MVIRVSRPFAIALCALVGFIAGFVAQGMVVFVLGVTRETDALYATLGLPTVVSLVATTPLTNLMAPRLAGLDPESSKRVASQVAMALWMLGLPITVSLVLTAPYWTDHLLPGFAPEYRLAVVRLGKIHAVALFASLAHGILWAQVAARDRFISGEASQAAVAVLTAILIFPIARVYGVFGIAWLFTARSILRTLVLLPISGVWPTRRFETHILAEVARDAAAPAAATAYHSSEQLLDRYLTSLAPAGRVSLYNLALSILTAALNVSSRALLSPLAPRLGRLSGEGDIAGVRRVAFVAASWSIVLGVLAWGGIAALGRPILDLLVGHGGVTEENVRTLWILTLSLGGMLGGAAVMQVFSHGLFALGRARTVSAAFIVCFTVGLALKIVGFWFWGVPGLALGASGFYWLAAAVYGVLFLKITQEVR